MTTESHEARAAQIAAQIRPALTQLYVTYFRLVGQSDLTGPQLTIMTRLAANGPSRIKEIAHQEGIQMPTASNALHQLEQRGMVERVQDPHDRRGVIVQLTAKGARELDRVGRERDTNIAQLLATLSEEQLDQAEKSIPLITYLASHYSPDSQA